MFFIVVESICVYVFYKKVICKDIISNHSLLHEVKMFCINFLRCVRSFFRINWKKERSGEEQDEIFEEIFKVIIKMFMALVVFLMFPFIISVMWYSFKEEKIFFLGLLFAAGIKVISEGLIKHKDEVVETIIFIMDINRFFIEQGNRMFDLKRKIKWKYVLGIGIMAFLSIFIAKGMVRLENVIVQNEKIAKISVGVALIGICIEWFAQRRRRKKEYESQKKEIIISGERLQKCRKEILLMCQKKGIIDIEIREEKGIGGAAQAFYQKNERSQIMIDTDMLDIVEEKHGIQKVLIYLKVLVAHELIHIMYEDSPNTIKNIRKTCIVDICIWGLGLMCVFIANNPIVLLLSVCIQIVAWVLFHICGDKRYWLQLQEIRADNIGMTLSNAAKEEIEEIYQTLLKERALEEENIMYQLYLKYAPEQMHVNINRRIKALELRRTWGSYYYIWLAFEIISGLLRKEGWYGKE